MIPIAKADGEDRVRKLEERMIRAPGAQVSTGFGILDSSSRGGLHSNPSRGPGPSSLSQPPPDSQHAKPASQVGMRPANEEGTGAKGMEGQECDENASTQRVASRTTTMTNIAAASSPSSMRDARAPTASAASSPKLPLAPSSSSSSLPNNVPDHHHQHKRESAAASPPPASSNKTSSANNNSAAITVSPSAQAAVAPVSGGMNAGAGVGGKRDTKFTPEEDELLLKLVAEFPSDWKMILEKGGEVFKLRTKDSLRKRHSTLKEKNAPPPKKANPSLPLAPPLNALYGVNPIVGEVVDLLTQDDDQEEDEGGGVEAPQLNNINKPPFSLVTNSTAAINMGGGFTDPKQTLIDSFLTVKSGLAGGAPSSTSSSITPPASLLLPSSVSTATTATAAGNTNTIGGKRPRPTSPSSLTRASPATTTASLTTASQTSNGSSSSLASLTPSLAIGPTTTTTTPPNQPLSTALAETQLQLKQLRLELERTAREKHVAEARGIELERDVEAARTAVVEAQRRTKETFEAVRRMVYEFDTHEGIRLRRRLAEESFWLGRPTMQRVPTYGGSTWREVWEDGQRKRDLIAREAELRAMREELDKSASSRKKQRRGSATQTGGAAGEEGIAPGGISASANVTGSSNNNNNNSLAVQDMDERANEEIRAMKFVRLRAEEARLVEDTVKFNADKAVHIRDLKRQRDEDASKYSTRPVLGDRYLLRSLLGKGGFSEVWRAFDLVEMRDVAVKIHEVDASWSEERRESYVRHAAREHQIHHQLDHARIVKMHDVFAVGELPGIARNSAFATVMEYCAGDDLDLHLKKQKDKCLPEKEAKALLLQIISGLLYLSEGGEAGNAANNNNNNVGARSAPSSSVPTPATGSGGGGPTTRRSVIHFDLKPANILFDAEGCVKITDFGLSKVAETVSSNSDATVATELTSQGAGTYYYLPPECFIHDRNNPPKISNKVDVWSVGVIFYQMLFGVRPFGEGQTQDAMWKEQTIVKATSVAFPSTPAVSEGAKDFIRRCLTHSAAHRPDVRGMCEDDYVRTSMRGGARASIAISAASTSSSNAKMSGVSSSTSSMPPPAFLPQ